MLFDIINQIRYDAIQILKKPQMISHNELTRTSSFLSFFPFLSLELREYQHQHQHQVATPTSVPTPTAIPTPPSTPTQQKDWKMEDKANYGTRSPFVAAARQTGNKSIRHASSEIVSEEKTRRSKAFHVDQKQILTHHRINIANRFKSVVETS